MDIIEYDANLPPLIPDHPYTLLNLDTYWRLTSNLAYEPENLKNIGGMISFLQQYVFETKRFEYSTAITDEEFNTYKLNAIIKTILVAEKIQSFSFLYPDYLSIVAQNYFLAGLWNISLKYYEKILNLPGVLCAANYSPTRYCEELELASKIIHNISVIYVCMNEIEKAKETMKKYKYIFDIKLERTERLVQSYPEHRSTYEHEYVQLKDVFDKKWFYFDSSLCSPLMPTSSLLDSVLSDCQKKNKSHMLWFLSDTRYRIVKNDYSTVKIVIVSGGTPELFTEPSENIILETVYRPYESVEFYNLNQESSS